MNVSESEKLSETDTFIRNFNSFKTQTYITMVDLQVLKDKK